jgi:PAS domain S-box-containing protein
LKNSPCSGTTAFSFTGTGQVSAEMNAFQWSSHPLGSPHTWPAPLKIAVNLILDSPESMYVLWGPELHFFSNDAYRPIMGPRAERAVGTTLPDLWPDALDALKPIIEKAFKGEASLFEHMPITMARYGQQEETSWSFSFTPLRDETVTVVGIVCITNETTQILRAEATAAQERERLMQMFDQAPSFMALLRGSDHTFEMVNPAYSNLIGGRDVTGKTVAKALNDAVEQGFVELLDGVYATGEPYVATGAKYVVDTGPGHPVNERYVDFVFQPLRDSDGSVNGIFVDGYDVTDRVRAQSERDAAHADLERIKERSQTWQVSPDLLGALNSEGHFATSNPAWYAMLGWTEAEVASMSIFELLHPGDVERTRAGFDLTQQGTPAIRFPNRYRCKDGSYRWISWVGVPEGGLVYCSGRDITDEVAQADALIAATAERDMMAGILATTDAFVMVLDLNYRWLAVNPAGAKEFERIFGTLPKIGDSMLDLLADQPNHRMAIEAMWSRALSGEEFTTVAPFGDLDDAGGHYQLKFNTLRDAAGNRIGAFQFATDVTTQANQAAALEAAEEALRQSQKMEAVGQLTGGLAHDFNNILAGVSGSLELMQTRLAQGRISDADRYLTGAQGAVRRAASLTQRLLAFSRRQTLEPKPSDLNRVVADMQDLVRRSVGPSIEIETVAAGGLWIAFVDVPQLENALLNLCINARDAMPDGGKLVIETGNRWLDRNAAKERGIEPGQYISLCVSDNGTGMSPQVIARAFDPFYTTKPSGQGTGLGLSMIHGFAGQSGGSVRIYSEVGKGTMVCLYLPRHQGESESPPESDVVTRVPAGSDDHETILVVDDEPLIRMVAVEQLEELGYTVLEAGDGPTALKLLNLPGKIDLLVTDVGLPAGMNGRQLADAARVARPDLHVLFITGYAENAVLNHGHLEPGMQVLTKPFSMESLAVRVRELIKRSK